MKIEKEETHLSQLDAWHTEEAAVYLFISLGSHGSDGPVGQPAGCPSRPFVFRNDRAHREKWQLPETQLNVGS